MVILQPVPRHSDFACAKFIRAENVPRQRMTVLAAATLFPILNSTIRSCLEEKNFFKGSS